MTEPAFADQLREAMTAEGLTQEQVEERSGVAQSTISSILKGADPKLSTVRALQRALPTLRGVHHAA